MKYIAVVCACLLAPALHGGEPSPMRLTMPTVKKLLEASRVVDRELQKAAAQQWARKFVCDNKDRDLSDLSLDEQAHWIDANMAPFARAIRTAGLTTREYLQLTLAYFGAAAADRVLQQIKGQEPAKGTVAENVEFIAQNRAELESYHRELSEIQKHIDAVLRPADDSK